MKSAVKNVEDVVKDNLKSPTKDTFDDDYQKAVDTFRDICNNQSVVCGIMLIVTADGKLFNTSNGHFYDIARATAIAHREQKAIIQNDIG